MYLNKILYLACFLVLLANLTSAESNDTIYVYETVYVVDTVWVDTPVCRDTIKLDPLEAIDDTGLLTDTINHNASLIYFSNDESATIPKNSILIDENQLKNVKMKKAGFFTLMFLAIQSISYAQPELSVKVGLSQFWGPTFSALGNSGLCIGENTGFEIKGPIKNSKFLLSLGYEMHGYGDELDIQLFSNEGNPVQHHSFKEVHRSIPVLIYYPLKKVEFFMGYEYRFVDYDYQYFSEEGFAFSGYRKENGFAAGLEYKMNKRLSLYGKAYIGNPFLGERLVRNSGTSLDFSVKYYVNRNN